jgi:hypothetical protein
MVAAPDACGDTPAPGFDWTKVPPVRPLPRPGAFLIPPTGPGYYSFLDVLQGDYRDKAPFQPYGRLVFYPTSFYEADFRYLDDPDNQQHDYWDYFKRLHLGDDWLFSTGGQVMIRYMDETDSRLTKVNNVYDLYRTRVNGDLWYQDRFRIFAEFIFADTGGQTLKPQPIDIERGDFLNGFFELKVLDIDNHPVYVRGGRQEMTLGSQRLISPLEWANTRRTFDGVHAYRTGENWDFDLFWTQPVIPNPNGLSSSDDRQNFSGAWSNYHWKKGSGIDLYYLNLDNANHVPFVAGSKPGPFNVSTVGSRVAGDENNWLYDVESMLQFGSYSGRDSLAGAFTAGGGYVFVDAPLTPQAWIYYDFASGSSNPTGTGDLSTFNQLFPFGHYYFGQMDLIGRQNIHDLNAQVACYPTPWITFITMYHQLWLDSPRDALYSSAGKPIRSDPTGKAGDDVGGILNFLVNFHLSTHSDLCVSYAKLFAGTFIDKSGPAVSPELFYVMYGYRW